VGQAGSGGAAVAGDPAQEAAAVPLRRLTGAEYAGAVLAAYQDPNLEQDDIDENWFPIPVLAPADPAKERA
jgi:hypothetical protein